MQYSVFQSLFFPLVVKALMQAYYSDIFFIVLRLVLFVLRRNSGIR